MNYHHLAARNQRTTGFKVKRAVQFGLLLAFCIWLLYQLKHPLVRSSGILGRKGNAGWWSRGGDSDDSDEAEKERDGGAAAADDDFEQDRAVKAYEETFLMERKKLRDKLATHGGKQDQKETGRLYEQSQIKDLYKGEFSKRENGNAPQSMTKEDKKGPEREAKEPQNHEEDHKRTSVWDQKGEVKENNEDKDPANVVKTSGVDNATIPGYRELEDGVHAFHDENGVPQGQDVDNIVESMPEESSADKKIFLHPVVTLSPNNQGVVVESLRGEEVEARKVDALTEDSEIDAAAEAEINSRMTSLNNDGSNINPASEEA